MSFVPFMDNPFGFFLYIYTVCGLWRILQTSACVYIGIVASSCAISSDFVGSRFSHSGWGGIRVSWFFSFSSGERVRAIFCWYLWLVAGGDSEEVEKELREAKGRNNGLMNKLWVRRLSLNCKCRFIRNASLIINRKGLSDYENDKNADFVLNNISIFF